MAEWGRDPSQAEVVMGRLRMGQSIVAAMSPSAVKSFQLINQSFKIVLTIANSCGAQHVRYDILEVLGAIR